MRGKESGFLADADSGSTGRATLLDYLVVQCRLREDYHRAEKRLILQLKAICRRRGAAKGRETDAMFEAMARCPNPETAGLFQALDIVAAQRKMYESSIKRLAKKLPVASWVETVPGVSYLSLGQMVAELWPVLVHSGEAESGCQGHDRRRQESRARYRLGLALVDGERQRKTRDKVLAKRMGYSPRRHAIMWNIGQNMKKASNRERGPYHALYLREKERQLALGLSRGHAENRAVRYATIKFLRHFLAEWNAAAT